MDAREAQIRGWINTGKHAIWTDYERATSGQSDSTPDDFGESEVENGSGDDISVVSSTASTASAPVAEKLIGADNDTLIPKPAEVDRVYQKGLDFWSQLVTSARSLPQTCLSAGLNDPSIILWDVPALPKVLPKRGTLIRRPLWHVPDMSTDRVSHEQNEISDFDYLYGVRKDFCLSYPTPVECRVSSQIAISHADPTAPDDGPCPPGLLLLTLC